MCNRNSGPESLYISNLMGMTASWLSHGAEKAYVMYSYMIVKSEKSVRKLIVLNRDLDC